MSTGGFLGGVTEAELYWVRGSQSGRCGLQCLSGRLCKGPEMEKGWALTGNK